MNPYDENFQELLIRSYAEAGDREAANRQVSACLEPSARAWHRPRSRRVPRRGSDGAGAAPRRWALRRSAARARLKAGDSAISAGSFEPGVRSLARAAAEAKACGAHELEAECWLALGTALVDSARGRDEEGAMRCCVPARSPRSTALAMLSPAPIASWDTSTFCSGAMPLRSAPGTGGDAGRIGRRASRRRGDARPRRRRHGRPRTARSHTSGVPSSWQNGPAATSRRRSRSPSWVARTSCARRSTTPERHSSARSPSPARSDGWPSSRGPNRGSPRPISLRAICQKAASASSTPGHWPPSPAIPLGGAAGQRLGRVACKEARSTGLACSRRHGGARRASPTPTSGSRRTRSRAGDRSGRGRTPPRAPVGRGSHLAHGADRHARACCPGLSAARRSRRRKRPRLSRDPRRRGRKPGAPASHPGPPRRPCRLIRPTGRGRVNS